MRQVLIFMASGIALMLAMAPPSDARAEAACAGARDPQILVNSFYDPVTLDTRTPLKELAGLVQSGTLTHEYPAAMSQGQMTLEADYEASSERLPDGGFCGAISLIRVRFGFKENMIRIAREVPKNSCSYRVVLGHEQKHIAVDQAIVTEFTPKIEAAFSQAANHIGGVARLSPGDVQRAIDFAFRDHLRNIATNLQETRSIRQSQIDTPEEYERVSHSCDGQLQAIIAERLSLLQAAQ